MFDLKFYKNLNWIRNMEENYQQDREVIWKIRGGFGNLHPEVYYKKFEFSTRLNMYNSVEMFELYLYLDTCYKYFENK